ncbi:hypothetical protein ACFP9V_19370 [Deinococcus radiopugnans]|uniref:Uncharacterized protein with GYD domain n=1 Tax=Deinococcus radiopugnans ATCC 19172 TaxID=585398 RepID=A0A5C4Y8X0_9DEIO|nr:hypothetical protein [Deinococcus radiopugnans]MBB6016786.1 uncharacterized protein with GYD domain [Deinococcus radiopugnans ATCC 19172]TNM71924.1 hypothetical protein FHR04_06025 [Deinococcus radiopugnans ATCC 19172]
MVKTPIRRFSYLDHDIEIIRDRTNLPAASQLEPRVGIQVRYGLKFDGQLTDWSAFVEATEDEASAQAMIELALRRAQALSNKKGFSGVSPAA